MNYELRANELLQLCDIKESGEYILDVTNKSVAEALERYIVTAALDVMSESSLEVYASFCQRNTSEKAYKVVMLGHNSWGKLVDAVNGKKIICRMASGEKMFEMERYGFILLLMQLPEETRTIFKPAIDDLIDYDIGNAYREYKNDKNCSESKKNVDTDSYDLIPLDKINNDDLLGEYFKTFQALGTFNSKKVYDNERQYELHDRLMLLYERIHTDV